MAVRVRSNSRPPITSPTNLAAAALQLAQQGYRVFPLQPRGKKPLIKQWQKVATTNAAQVQQWWQQHPTANIGIATGKLSGLYVLDRDGSAGSTSYKKLRCQALESTLQVVTSRGVHHYLQYPSKGIRNSAGHVATGIDVRGEGGYVVAPPSVHPSGHVYRWHNHGAPLQSWLPPNGDGKHSAVLAQHAQQAKRTAGPAAGMPERIPAGERNSTLAAEAGAMRNRGLSTEAIKAALQVLNCEHCDPPLDAAEVDKIAESIGTYEPQPGAPLLKLSQLGVLSETDLGQMFVTAHPDLRYVDKHGAWYVYNGTHWQEDSILQAWNLARKFAVQVGATRTQGRGRIQSVKTINAVVRVAAAHESVATSMDQLDTHAHLLNTPAGTYDLDSGTMLPHRPEHLLTRITAVAPDPKLRTPLWHSHLKLITAGDAAYIDFLQCMAGYFLLGEAPLDKLFFLCGGGGNGKGTLMDNLTGPLGINSETGSSYACTAPPEAFMRTHHPQHPEALARLRGARLVLTNEVPEGQWNEELLKLVTGGGQIAAHFMRQDTFSYTPQFKLVITSNNKPRLRSVDKAIRRRFLLLPFNVDIEKELGHLDAEMRTHKLRREWPGILQWMITGYRKYREQGLVVPKVVQVATDEYLQREDALGNWLGEMCDREGRTGLGELYLSYASWCESNGELSVRNKRTFGSDLEARGFTRELDKHTKGPAFLGLSVKKQFKY